MPGKLTDGQKLALRAFDEAATRHHRGLDSADIMSAGGLASRARARTLINALFDSGLIQHVGTSYGGSLTYAITPAGRLALEQEASHAE